jgi:hypothetical protein
MPQGTDRVIAMSARGNPPTQQVIQFDMPPLQETDHAMRCLAVMRTLAVSAGWEEDNSGAAGCLVAARVMTTTGWPSWRIELFLCTDADRYDGEALTRRARDLFEQLGYLGPDQPTAGVLLREVHASSMSRIQGRLEYTHGLMWVAGDGIGYCRRAQAPPD